MVQQKFSKRLKDWRGDRLQKEAADLLSVPLKTYQNWEQEMNEPDRFRLPELERRMIDNPKQ